MLIIILYHHHVMNTAIMTSFPFVYIKHPRFREMEESPADAESSDDEDNCENLDKSKIPKKRFPWTDEAK